MINKYEIYNNGLEREITNLDHLDAALEIIRRGFISGLLKPNVFGINLPIFITEEINKMLDEKIFKFRQEFIIDTDYDWANQWFVNELERFKDSPEVKTIKSEIQSWAFSGQKSLTAKIFDDVPESGFRKANALEMANFSVDFSYFANMYNVLGEKIGDFFPCTYRTYIESHEPDFRLANAFLSFSKNPNFRTRWDGHRTYCLGIKLE
jgi:hypothetical protein